MTVTPPTASVSRRRPSRYSAEQDAQRLRDGVVGALAALERAVSVGERQRQLTGRPVALTPVGVEPLKFAHRVAREREQGDLPVAEVHRRQHDNVRECIDVAGAVGIFRLLRVDAEQEEGRDIAVIAVELTAVADRAFVYDLQRFFRLLRGWRFLLRKRRLRSLRRCGGLLERGEIRGGRILPHPLSAQVNVQRQRAHGRGQHDQNADQNDADPAPALFLFRCAVLRRVFCCVRGYFFCRAFRLL